MTLITSIHKLPLHTFIDCMCDGEYKGLIVDGEPTEEQLVIVWNDILEQYSDALGDEGSKRYILAYKEYQQAKTRYELANTYIELLNNYYKQGVIVPKWITDLNSLVGASYSFDKEKPEAFEKYLSSCFKRNKGNLIRYNLAQDKLEAISKISVEGDNKKPDRAYFTKVLVNLKDMKSREIPDTISTYEFCVLVNHYKQHLQYLENQKTKNGRR